MKREYCIERWRVSHPHTVARNEAMHMYQLSGPPARINSQQKGRVGKKGRIHTSRTTRLGIFTTSFTGFASSWAWRRMRCAKSTLGSHPHTYLTAAGPPAFFSLPFAFRAGGASFAGSRIAAGLLTNTRSQRFSSLTGLNRQTSLQAHVPASPHTNSWERHWWRRPRYALTRGGSQIQWPRHHSRLPRPPGNK
jgi:hypothetical protein